MTSNVSTQLGIKLFLITNFGHKLNVNVHEVNVLDSFKKIANDLDEQIENQRDKIRESLVKKGIDERNSVLIKSNGELNN